MSRQPEWVSWPLARAAFFRQAVEHGGRANYDQVKFLAALAWPQAVCHFMGRVNLFDVAAAYADGVLRMRPFAQGNGRMAWLLCVLFMRFNGVRIASPIGERVAMITLLMRGLVDRPAFSRWLKLCHVSYLHGGERTVVSLRLRDKKVVGISILDPKRTASAVATSDRSAKAELSAANRSAT